MISAIRGWKERSRSCEYDDEIIVYLIAGPATVTGDQMFLDLFIPQGFHRVSAGRNIGLPAHCDNGNQ